MPKGRLMLIALTVALCAGVLLTVASGLLVRRGSVTDCAASPCVRYSAYGWPLKWRTNTPWPLIQTTGMDLGVWGYDRDGFSFGRFATNTLLLSVPVVVIEIAGFGIWRAPIPPRRRS